MADDNWGEIDTSQPSGQNEDKIEYEIEGAEPNEAAKESKPAKKVSAEDDPLDGVETKGAQKRIRQLVKRSKDAEEAAATFAARTQELEQQLSKQTTDYTKSQSESNDFTEKQLSEKIEYNKEILKDAMESQEFDKVVAAQEDLSNSQFDLRRVQDAKANFTAMREEEETLKTQRAEQIQRQPQQQQQQQEQVDERAVAYAEDNSEWFGKDEVMTAAAIAIDAKIKKEGWTPQDDDYYDEITSRMTEAFPTKFESKEDDVSHDGSTSRKDTSKRPTQTVSGGSRSPKSSSTKIKLTEQDVAQAKKWNIPLDRYAAEKLKTENDDDEYTDITL